MPKREKGWITEFYEFLEYLLTKRCGRNGRLKIWWDQKKLDDNVVFDDSIAEGIKKSAIMICFNSRSYQESDYCQKELTFFYEKAKEEELGLKVGHRSRIVQVLVENIPYTEWPEVLGKNPTSGFKFNTGQEDELGDPVKTESAEFEEQIIKLRNSIWAMIDDLTNGKGADEEGEGGKTVEAAQSATDEFTIYLGEVTDALYDRRDGIMSELEASGFRVLCGEPCTTKAAEHASQTEAAINQSQLAVHLLGEFPGKKIKDDPACRYIQQQVEIGLASATPQLIWMGEDLDIDRVENDDHRSFLKEIEDRTLSEKAYDFIRVNEGELARIIIEQANELKEAKRQEQAVENSSNKGPLTVLLDTHFDDNIHAFNLKKMLSKHNIDIIFNVEDGDPVENIRSIYQNISEAQKIIFLFGSEAHKDWIDIRVNNTLKKLLDYKRYSQDIFIYMAPPEKKQDVIEVARHPLVKLIDFSDKSTLDEKELEEFLNQLTQAAQ
jgi:hypothetical protein